MKLLKYLLPVMVTVGGLSLRANDFEGYSTAAQAKQVDFEALQKYIQDKRAISIQNKGGNLMVSGDIVTEYYYMHTYVKGKPYRGVATRELDVNKETKQRAAVNAFRFDNPRDTRTKMTPKAFSKLSRTAKKIYHKDLKDVLPPQGSSEFDVESNIYFDYEAERGKGSVQLQFSNPCGINELERRPMVSDSRKLLFGSGKKNGVSLRQCYGSYNVWEDGVSRFDVEIGRRKLKDVFRSDVQFDATFDGILANYSNSIEGVTDMSVKAAAFVVDYTVHHWGYAGEIGLLNLKDSGIDCIYSLIKWDRHGKNRYGLNRPLGGRYVNSQFMVSYKVNPDILRVPTVVYTGYVVNHAAIATKHTHHRKSNDALFMGLRCGKASRKGDCAFGIGYQIVGAQAVSDRDLPGASRDNPYGVSSLCRRSGGFGNYQGVIAQGVFAVTDNWTLDTHVSRLRERSHHIGGSYRSYELYAAAIFSF